MLRKSFQMFEIEQLIEMGLDSNRLEHNIIVSDDNAHQLICRIRIKIPKNAQENPLQYLKKFEKDLLSLHLRGIEKIERCYVGRFQERLY